MGSLVLDYKSFVTNHAVEDSWLLDSPVADECPLLGVLLFVILLLCVRSFPPRFPVVCELFEEGTFDGCGLRVLDEASSLVQCKAVNLL